MLDRVRHSLHRVLVAQAGDGFIGVRVPRDLARRMNVVFGEPICSREELDRRRSARARLFELRRGGGQVVPETPREAAPVVVYFEGDRNGRQLERIKDLLTSKGIPFSALDVSGDETTMAYVVREARCKSDELPVVFVAASPIGDYNALAAADVAGSLDAAVFGARPAARA